MSKPSSVSAAVVLLALGGLVGCGYARAPSKDAFRAGLEPIVRDVFCRSIDVMPFDVEGQDGGAAFPVVTSPKRTMFGPGSDGRSVAMLDAAAGVGLVTRIAIDRPAKWKGTDGPFVRQALIAYSPTEKGVPYFRAVERKATGRMVSVPSICIANGEVVDVVRWSEPADLGGRRVSQVTYTYHGVDPIPAMPRSEQAAMAEPKEATVPFELQSDGWRPMAR